jgi:hypothetical protein
MKVSYRTGLSGALAWKRLCGHHEVDIVTSCFQTSAGLGRRICQGSETRNTVAYRGDLLMINTREVLLHKECCYQKKMDGIIRPQHIAKRAYRTSSRLQNIVRLLTGIA